MSSPSPNRTVPRPGPARPQASATANGARTTLGTRAADLPKPTIEYLPVRRLTVDHAVQRERVKIPRAAKIAADFDENALGVFTISRRGADDEKILDGMHRRYACEIAGKLDLIVTCKVYEGLTTAQEAHLFRVLNTTEKPGQLDMFRARVQEGDPTAVAITKMLARHGWKVASGNAEGYINAVGAVERSWTRDRFALERAITTITAAWGRDPGGADGRIIEGLNLLYTRYGDLADANEMASKLAKGGTAGTLIGKARALAQITQIAAAPAMAETLVGIYNRGRRTRPLPDWRSA